MPIGTVRTRVLHRFKHVLGTLGQVRITDHNRILVNCLRANRQHQLLGLPLVAVLGDMALALFVIEIGQGVVVKRQAPLASSSSAIFSFRLSWS